MKIDAVNSSGTTQYFENKTNNQGQIDTQNDAMPTGEAGNKAKKTDETDPAKLQAAVDELNKKAKEGKYEVRFAVNKEPNRIIIEVVDKTNNQVISTFPPKQILDMAAEIDKELKLLDKKI